MKHARKDYDRIQDPAGLIPVDEPVFLIRGQDPVGWEAVEWWAKINRWAKGDPKLSELAFEHADLMRAWRPKKPAIL